MSLERQKQAVEQKQKNQSQLFDEHYKQAKETLQTQAAHQQQFENIVEDQLNAPQYNKELQSIENSKALLCIKPLALTAMCKLTLGAALKAGLYLLGTIPSGVKSLGMSSLLFAGTAYWALAGRKMLNASYLT